MVVRMKHTKGKRNSVRSHHAMAHIQFTSCTRCHQPALPHMVC
ncbi:MAG: 50S ribosomal protein L32, partial [Candidatus Colwellbacteria bacterium]|nr:50S ribosomal protein L32 [Candidatus Colwellbacteria bacterium]